MPCSSGPYASFNSHLVSIFSSQAQLYFLLNFRLIKFVFHTTECLNGFSGHVKKRIGAYVELTSWWVEWIDLVGVGPVMRLCMSRSSASFVRFTFLRYRRDLRDVTHGHRIALSLEICWKSLLLKLHFGILHPVMKKIHLNFASYRLKSAHYSRHYKSFKVIFLKCT